MSTLDATDLLLLRAATRGEITYTTSYFKNGKPVDADTGLRLEQLWRAAYLQFANVRAKCTPMILTVTGQDVLR